MVLQVWEWELVSGLEMGVGWKEGWVEPFIKYMNLKQKHVEKKRMY